MTELQELITVNVPSGFFQTLASRQDWMYGEAERVSSASPLWQTPEGRTIEPIIRRGIFENEFRKAAKEHGLKCFDMQHEGRNYGYVMVEAGKLALTSHHVGGPDQFVRPCVSRKQNAGVNEWLDGYLDLTDDKPPDLTTPGPIYINVLHGKVVRENADQEISRTFLQVAVPNSEFDSYLQNYSAVEMLVSYPQFQGTRIEDLPDNVKPVINIKKKKKENAAS